MPMWRCPHCGTPQAETARCWVCRRSSTTCSTCRHFRRSVAAQLGYCGLDRRRLPLSGLELRGCWDAGPVRSPDTFPVAPAVLEGAEPPSAALRLRDFVPVEVARRTASAPGAGDAALAGGISPQPAAGGAVDAAVAAGATADRVTLFADAEL